MAGAERRREKVRARERARARSETERERERVQTQRRSVGLIKRASSREDTCQLHEGQMQHFML